MRYPFLVLLLLTSALSTAQETPDLSLKVKRFATKDSIVVDSVSINSTFFEVHLKNGQVLDTSLYTIDYGNALFLMKPAQTIPSDTLIIKYKAYPEFLTKRYFRYNPDRIVSGNGAIEKVYAVKANSSTRRITPFEGLTTSGSIVRGVTTGNNQNSTVNSELDLQISGKLSDKVGIRASIQDANIPQQDGGYSQRLDEFDQIFIELYSDNWNIRAGDINLEENQSYFGRFTKKVQGLSLNGTINHENSATNVFATGALVRGVFAQSRFIAQEGNQGPYKLTGPNGELYVLIISGSERVYVNGILLERGETEDYVIDYNAGEIRFNPTFPITSEMRISVEYQFSEQNFTRIIAYGGGGYTTDNSKLNIRAHVYSESDAKNQPLLQNLNEDQVDLLQLAGDDQSQMIAPSANPDTYSENKILYRKEIQNGQEIFVFSNNPDDELFNVRFSRVGTNQGNYILGSNNAISRIYEYVAPVNGIRQGEYAPVIQLFAPTKLQMAVVQGDYNPSSASNISFEAAGSKNDLNLFSDVDDGNNDGFAGRLRMKQRIFGDAEATSRLQAFGNMDYIQENFRNVERTYNIEFSRDWNLPLRPFGNQTFITSGLQYLSKEILANYSYENLNYAENYSGNRHVLNALINGKKFKANINSSHLITDADTSSTTFFRLNANGVYGLKKYWLGARIRAEDNVLKSKSSGTLNPLSQKFWSYEGYVGIGDSTKVFAEVGYRLRFNDSLRNNAVQRVNESDTYYLKSQLLKNENTSLSLFLNYRNLTYKENRADEKSLNSRLMYDQYLFNRLLRWNTVFETSSGTLPQQEYTFVKVDEGQGTHTWNDYNGDDVQQLDEFEVAQFRDEADYIKVLLPNQIFIKTHQNKLSQLVTFNLQQWSGQTGLKKILSHFYNQTSYLIDRKVLRQGNDFDINPFNEDQDDLGLNLSLRNTLFFNRGKQRYTTNYTYIATTTKNLLSVGLQENKLRSHQITFQNKVKESYLTSLKSEFGFNESESENFNNRNFKIDNLLLEPKLSYLFGDNSRIEGFYSYTKKENRLGERESLERQNLGIAFALTNGAKLSLNGEVKYINNKFEGSPFSPVSYQMLEGLQPGTNFTWNLTGQRRITKYLDLNVSYFGRSSETSRTIHTGSVQLRAYF